MVRKWAIAVSYIVIAIVIYVYGQEILDWFHLTDNVFIVVIFATVLALFPVIPYPVVGGVLGAAFGPVLGTLLTWLGSLIASLLMFLFVRYGYQEWGSKVLQKYDRIGKVNVMFERNAFLTILFARLALIIPSVVINIYAALSRVSFLSYAAASSLGKIPAMLLVVMIGDSLLSGPRNIVISLVVYGGFLAVTLTFYRIWKKRKVEGGSR
jgi:uncharacterized membrane protein YdjX (TVP38/TMEM64 family)